MLTSALGEAGRNGGCKAVQKTSQEAKVPLGMGDLFSYRRRVAVACKSCMEKKIVSLCGI